MKLLNQRIDDELIKYEYRLFHVQSQHAVYSTIPSWMLLDQMDALAALKSLLHASL